MINTIMNTHSDPIVQSYADWITSKNYEYYFVLNQAPLAGRTNSYAALERQVKKLFTLLECDEWGKHRRMRTGRGTKYCRIERAVLIEKSSYYHANVLVRSWRGHDTDTIVERIKSNWLKIQDYQGCMDENFLINVGDNSIRNRSAVSAYCCKDISRVNNSLDDVLSIKASFIRKT